MSGKFNLLGFIPIEETINAISFSYDNTYLAVAGSNGVTIWTAYGLKMVKLPMSPALVPGISALTWLYFKDMKRDILIMGSVKGELLSWIAEENAQAFTIGSRKATAARDRILCLDRLPTNGNLWQVASVSQDCIVQTWKVNDTGRWESLFSFENLKFNYISVFFYQPKDSIIIFTSNGKIIELDRLTGVFKSEKEIPVLSMYVPIYDPIMGESSHRSSANASFHSITKRIVFDNNVNGFEICQLDDLRSITSLPTAPVLSHKSRQISFVNGGSLLVGGSDGGYARVFDTDGKVLQDLVLPDKSLHHIVTGSRDKRSALVAVGSSDLSGMQCVGVWQLREKKPWRPMSSAGQSAEDVASPFIVLLVLFIAYVVYNEMERMEAPFDFSAFTLGRGGASPTVLGSFSSTLQETSVISTVITTSTTPVSEIQSVPESTPDIKVDRMEILWQFHKASAARSVTDVASSSSVSLISITETHSSTMASVTMASVAQPENLLHETVNLKGEEARSLGDNTVGEL